MSGQWEGRARRGLLDRRGRSGAWGYRGSGAPGVEPTALAILGLIASEDITSSADDVSANREAAAWLTAIQRRTGRSRPPRVPRCPDGQRLMRCSPGADWRGFEVQRRRACHWLLGMEGRPLPPSAEGGVGGRPRPDP